MLPKLEVGQQIWGYNGRPVVVCGTEYQQYGEVYRVNAHEYRARIAGRPDYTGFEDYYPSLQQAMVAARLPMDKEVVLQGEGIYKILRD